MGRTREKPECCVQVLVSPMEYSAWRDAKIAAMLAGIFELVLVCLAFAFGSELLERNTWLEYLQMPGAQISERLFHRVGYLQGVASTFVIQWALFTPLILGLLYCYRGFRSRHSAGGL